MSGFYNVGSLVLGILAWVIPARIIFGGRRTNNVAKSIILSFSACAVSLSWQILEIHHRVTINDFGAIEDTIGGIASAAILLVSGTVALNLLAVRVTNKKK